MGSGPCSYGRVIPIVVAFCLAVWAGLSITAIVRPHPAPPADAMTVGCLEASCCTSRCFLDDSGVHHCVPNNDSPCDCGLSSEDAPSPSVLAIEAATLPAPQNLGVDFTALGTLDANETSVPHVDISVPSPPPKPRASC